MPKVAPGGRGYRHNPHPFEAHTSNTICDVTGFRVKISDVVRRWEGFYVIPAAWHPRQPQDFPVVPVKQRIYPNTRQGTADAEIEVDQYLEDTGGFDDGFSSGYDIDEITII